MKINKYTITSLIFLAIICIIGILTIWNNRESFLNIVKSGNVIENTNQIYADNVAFSNEFINMWSQTQSLSEAQLLDDAEYGVIIKDKNGSLYFPASDVNVTPYAENTIKFAKTLENKKVPFIYIQAPNKYIEGYTDEIVSEYNFSNKNATEFLNILKNNKIDTLDLRELIIKENLDKESLFYKTDHHWTTSTAFWAYTKIVKCLNDKYDFDIDKNNFYTDIKNYKQKVIENCYLGSLGRRVGRAVSGLDNYTFIEPSFETDYKIFNGLTSKTEPIFSGNFNKAIVKENILNGSDVTLNKHASYFEWDYGDLIIKNTLIDNDIKILLIKDSYSLPVMAFLSTCVSEIHSADLRDIPCINLSEYINEYDFDAVIMMYNTEVFNDTMFNFE